MLATPHGSVPPMEVKKLETPDRSEVKTGTVDAVPVAPIDVVKLETPDGSEVNTGTVEAVPVASAVDSGKLIVAFTGHQSEETAVPVATGPVEAVPVAPIDVVKLQTPEGSEVNTGTVEAVPVAPSDDSGKVMLAFPGQGQFVGRAEE